MRNLRSLIKYSLVYKGHLSIALTMMLFQVVIGFVIPYLMIDIIDIALPNGDMTMIYTRGALMIGIALLGALAGVVNNYSSQYVSQYATAALREDLFSHIQSLAFKDIDTFKKSRLITTATSDVMRIQMFYGMMLSIVVRAPLMVIVGLVLSLQTSLLLSQVFYVTMPLLIISFLVIMYFAYPRFKKVQGALDELSNVVLENANAPQVVKSFVSQDYEAKRFEKVNDHYKEVNTNAESIVALAEPLIIMIFNLGLALILVLAGIYLNQANPAFFQNGLPKVGLIMAFSTYSQQILIGLMMFAMIMIFISRAEVSASRINEVMETLPSMLYNEHPVFPEIKGEISFNKVSFKYGESSADAIQDISFKLKPGESVGIIGSTGSGKTTLVRLLPRLYDHTEGEILLDGVPVESMDVTHLRDQISFVTQYAHIFSGSLGTNIIQGKQTADYEEVFKASQGASLDEFVSDQEEGLNLFVQAKGTNLSGGQKQRLSIARALIKNPKILILDDATSAVDLTTEKHIIESIQALKPKPTLLLITQKISTAKRLDKILVLDNDGHMDGFGTHETLLKSSKVYQEIAASQLNVGGESHGA